MSSPPSPRPPCFWVTFNFSPFSTRSCTCMGAGAAPSVPLRFQGEMSKSTVREEPSNLPQHKKREVVTISQHCSNPQQAKLSHQVPCWDASWAVVFRVPQNFYTPLNVLEKHHPNDSSVQPYSRVIKSMHRYTRCQRNHHRTPEKPGENIALGIHINDVMRIRTSATLPLMDDRTLRDPLPPNLRKYDCRPPCHIIQMSLQIRPAAGMWIQKPC